MAIGGPRLRIAGLTVKRLGNLEKSIYARRRASNCVLGSIPRSRLPEFTKHQLEQAGFKIGPGVDLKAKS
jgi:hypothetical protein